MKTCPDPKCRSHNIIMFDSDNDLCKKCKKWFPAVVDKKLENIDIELITKLADDVWEVGKKLELKEFEISKNLKTISGCLHDLRAGRDTKWYKIFKVTNKVK